ncbi:hypothetical protein MKZ38_003750 [Zalerion maritima]|uniref:DRBM domain-containing protein n=1 Tax=Zalerion maritima TaxID=339359 RepID=A0AAD5RMF4_9PEZI|nr:hypothetical protein MKZ38_003750 [Zalerion maritima]
MEGIQELSMLISNTKAWIEQQEQAIHVTGQLPNITPAHTGALRLLSLASLPEPDIADENWIGQLLEHHQANPSHPPPKFSEKTVPGPNGTFQWCCTVLVPPHQEPFPRPEDWEKTGHTSIPSWSKKKVAKQYACKCAVQWLSLQASSQGPVGAGKKRTKAAATMTTTRSPSDTTTASPGVQKNPTSNGIVNASSSVPGDNSWWATRQSSPMNGYGGGGGGGGAPLFLAHPPTSEPDEQFHDCEEPRLPGDEASSAPSNRSGPMDMDNELPMTQKVTDLCNQLKLPAPRYDITPCATDANSGAGWHGKHQLFDGYADWGLETPRDLPSRVAIVSGILSKKGCREKVAEEILKALQPVVEERKSNMTRAFGFD